jgi:GNAT superfamily N-acetyltransferase
VVELRRIPGDAPEALALLAEMEAWIARESGPVTPERTSTVTAVELCPPRGAYVVVLEDGEVVAGGGMRRLADGVGELKRMYTRPAGRGRGHGRRLLAELEAAALELGFTRLRLDTGASMLAAQALYRSAGYVPIADYNGNSYAGFWGEKALG